MTEKIQQLFSKTRWITRKKSTVHPSRRWGHSATLHLDSLYILGGRLASQTTRKPDPLFRLNLATWDFQRIAGTGTPSLRDSHVAVSLNNKLYIWGGCTGQKVNSNFQPLNSNPLSVFQSIQSLQTTHSNPCIANLQVTNELYTYDSQNWHLETQFGQVPQPRQSAVAVTLQERFILLYGGCADQTVFHDFYLLDIHSLTWTRLATPSDFQARENSAVTVLNNQIYFFGGEDAKQNYLNSLQKLTIDWAEKGISLRCTTVRTHLKCPQPRIGHSLLGYQGRFLILIGGETIINDKPDFLNDVWVFDAETCEWQQLRCRDEAIFKKRSYFSATIFQDQIVLFGGLKSVQKFNSSDELLVLQLIDEAEFAIQKKPNGLCDLCKNTLPRHSRFKSRISNTPPPEKTLQTVSLNIFYRLAKALPHPFVAVSKLLSQELLARSSEVQIKKVAGLASKQMIKLEYHLEAGSQLILTRLDHNSLLQTFFPAFKLSHSFVVVIRPVLGTNSIVAYYNPSFCSFYSSPSDFNAYRTLSQFVPLSIIENTTATLTVVLLDPNTNSSTGEPELKTTQNDFIYTVGNRIQLSLQSYLQNMWLEPRTRTRIVLNGQKIEPQGSRPNLELEEVNISAICPGKIYFAPQTKGAEGGSQQIKIYVGKCLYSYYSLSLKDRFMGWVELDSFQNLEELETQIEGCLHEHLNGCRLKRRPEMPSEQLYQKLTTTV